MAVLSSLQNRIFLASALLAVLPLAVVFRFVSGRLMREAEDELRRSVEVSATLVEQHHAARLESLTTMARLVADLPKLKAAVATHDAPTVKPIAADYQSRVHADVLVVTDRDRVLVSLGTPPTALAGVPAIAQALEGKEGRTFRVEARVLLEIVTVPLSVGPDPPEILGTLSLGFPIDHALAAHLKAVTGSDVAFVLDGEQLASTLRGKEAFVDPVYLLQPRNEKYARMVFGDYAGLARPLDPATVGGPVAVVLRSHSERLRTARTLNALLLLAALAAVAVAVLLSYALARTVTRPLAALTRTMSEVAATGDLTRKIALARTWDDEDARGLARTFNLLTDSIARFQREARERERLEALGRLSTVIAHEVRNPLMIIKASLRTLRREGLSPEDYRESASDIDHEVKRLDRIVGDVLDFARKPRIDCAPADLNAICREAAEATLAGDDGLALKLTLDATLEPVVTDAERLRTVLVNVLVNAAESVRARGDERRSTHVAPDFADARWDIEVRTLVPSPGRARIVVTDRGEGIDPAHLAHIFEPYYTTRRTGTGLGLAIAESIVDALGGTIAARSHTGEGTEIAIELPVAGPAVATPAAAGTAVNATATAADGTPAANASPATWTRG